MKKIVYVDMDGVLVDFNSGIIPSLTFQNMFNIVRRADIIKSGIFSKCFPHNLDASCSKTLLSIGEI